MERRGYNDFLRGGGHSRNGYYHHNSRNHHHAPRHGRPNLHQQNHQPRHNHQPPPLQLPAPQHGPPPNQYNPYQYYAPVATVMSSPQMSTTNMTSQYTLSPNAQEFIPSSFMAMPLQSGMLLVEPQAQMHQQMQHHHQHHMQHQPQQLYHHEAAGPPVNDSYEDPFSYYNKSYDEEDDAVLQLQMFITDVTLSPELFHLKVNDVVNVMFEDICIRKNPAAPLVAIIFQAGVLQQNFRYSGANLCSTANGMVKTLDGEPIFRNCLIQHMYESLAKVKPVVGDKNRDKETRGTVLFCAELFFQLDLGFKLDLSDSYPDIGVMLIDTIKQLILCNEKENQKSGIQALKLCGANLEKLCGKNEAMDELMAQCKTLEEQEGVDSTIQFMLARLPQLRKTNWNRVEKTPVPEYQISQNNVSEDYNQQPVMYGPDGQPINEEELDFLNGINQVAAGDFTEAAPSAGSLPAGMDEEAFKAYEEFLRETGQK